MSDTEYDSLFPVSREQMASFVARLIERSGGKGGGRHDPSGMVSHPGPGSGYVRSQ